MIGSFMLLVALLATDELVPAFTYCWNNPKAYVAMLVRGTVCVQAHKHSSHLSLDAHCGSDGCHIVWSPGHVLHLCG